MSISTAMRLIDRIVDSKAKNLFLNSLVVTVVSLAFSHTYFLILRAFYPNSIVGSLSFNIAAGSFVSILSIFGMDTFLLKKLNESHDLKRDDIILFVFLAISSACTAFILTFLISFWIKLSSVMLLYVPSITLLTIISFVAQSKIIPSFAMLFRRLAIPLCVVVAGCTLFLLKAKTGYENILYVVSIFVDLIVLITFIELIRRVKKTDSRIKIGMFVKRFFEAYRFGLLFVAFSFSFTIMYTADILILGMKSSPQIVGLYTISASVAAFGNIGLWVINTFSPILIRKLYVNKKIRSLNLILKNLSIFSSILLFPCFIIGFLFLYIMFHHEANFSTYLFVYSIYFIGVAVNVLSGPCGYVLNLAGESKQSTKIIMIGVRLNVVISIVLVHWLGPVGVAIGAAAGNVYMNSTMHKVALKKLLIRPGLLGFRIHKLGRYITPSSAA